MYNIGHINLNSDFFNLNKPFFSLYKNLELLNQKINGVKFSKYSLTDLRLEINGVKDKFIISNNELFVKDFKTLYIESNNYYKKDMVYNSKTPLNYKEIQSYMDKNGYISQYMYFETPLSINILKNSNFISIEDADNNGFKKQTDLKLPYLSVEFNKPKLDSNYILNINKLSSFFIAKNSTYSITLTNVILDKIHTNNISIKSLYVENYITSPEAKFVPLYNEVKNIFVKDTEQTNLYIKKLSLNSPINNQAYEDIADNFVSLEQKQINSISFKRERDLEDNDVISVGESNDLISNLINKKMNISFKDSGDFLKFIKASCFSDLFLKKDLVVKSDVGYISSDASQFESSVNHLGFKHLLDTQKDYDTSCQDCNLTDSGEIHFSDYDSHKKEKIQKIAQELNIDLDFSKNTYGKIFACVCDLIMKLSYPNKNLLKKITSLKEGAPLNKDLFIVMPPIFAFSPKLSLGNIPFVMPFYLKTQNTLIIIPATLNFPEKNNPYLTFNMPFVSNTSDSLIMFSPQLISNHTPNTINSSINNPKLTTDKCGLDTNTSISTNSVTGQFILHNKDGKFGIVASKRAFNNIDAAYIYSKINESLQEKYYACHNCLMKKNVAAILLTYKAINYMHKKHSEIPIRVELTSLLEEKTQAKKENNNSSSNEERCLCGDSSSSSNSQEPLILSHFKVNSNYILNKECELGQTNTVSNLNVKINNWELEKIEEEALDFMDKIAEFWNFKSCENSLHKSNTLDLTSNNYTTSYKDSVKFHVNYAFDVIGNTSIGYINNDSPCSKTFTNNKYEIEYIKLSPIYGKDTSLPTTLKENTDNLKSDIVSKLYIITDDNVKTENTIDLTTLKSLQKREKTYIISTGKEGKLNYLDIDNKIFYSDSGLRATISKNDNKDKYILINKLKIGPVSIDKIENRKLEITDSSLMCEAIQLLTEKDLETSMSNTHFDIGNFLQNSELLKPLTSYELWTSIAIKPAPKKPDFVVDLDKYTDETQMGSGSNLESKATIASPACELYANDNDKIPANFSTIIKTSLTLRDKKTKKDTLINIKTPISIGVIDGLYSSKIPGDLLALATTSNEVEELKKQYQFDLKYYVLPIGVDLYHMTDKGDYKQITIDITKLLKKVKNKNGSEFSYKGKSLSDILNKKLKDVELFFKGMELLNSFVRFKSVTANATYPVAVTDSSSGLASLKSNEKTSKNMLKFGIPYYFKESEQQCYILLPKRVLQDTGTKLEFLQQKA